VLGNNPDEYLHELHEYDGAGYTQGVSIRFEPDQEGFLNFAKSELLPRL
jgi:hypothetical protein